MTTVDASAGWVSTIAPLSIHIAEHVQVSAEWFSLDMDQIGPLSNTSMIPIRAAPASVRHLTLLIGLAFVLAAAPRRAAADIPSSDVEFMYYGRMGIGWTPSGQVVAGKYMNLGARKAIGGRLEEGDYLQPGFRYHIKKAKYEGDTTIDLVKE